MIFCCLRVTSACLYSAIRPSQGTENSPGPGEGRLITLHISKMTYLDQEFNECCEIYMAPKYDIRTPTSSDATAISGVISTSFSQTFGHALSESDLAGAIAGPLSPESLHKQLCDPDSHFLIATAMPEEGEESIAGVIHTSNAAPHPSLQLSEPVYLRKLYVDSAHHGTGLAGRLLVAAEEEAKKQGYKSIWLGVWDHNTRGVRFYEKMGYVKQGEKVTELGGNQKDIIMEKAL